MSQELPAQFNSNHTERIPSSIKEEWFAVNIEGNLRLPQTFVGIFPLVGNELLKDAHPDIDTFLHSQLSDEQLQKIKSTMAAAHKAKNIPASHAANITDERLQELWNSTKVSVASHIIDALNLFLPEHNKARTDVESVIDKQHPDMQKVFDFYSSQINPILRGENVSEYIRPLSKALLCK